MATEGFLQGAEVGDTLGSEHSDFAVKVCRLSRQLGQEHAWV